MTHREDDPHISLSELLRELQNRRDIEPLDPEHEPALMALAILDLTYQLLDAIVNEEMP